MMKVYINIKKYSGLHFHQPLNKRILPMKREGMHDTLHHFSFGERFDEVLMIAHCIGYQHIKPLNHQFIGFSSLNKSAGKATRVSTAIRRLAGRTSGRPADKGEPMFPAKRKRRPTAVETATGFWGRKSHSIAH